MLNQSPDLRIRAGRVVCPASGFDGPGEVDVRGGRIVALRESTNFASTPAESVLDFPDAILLPGLVDIHAHPCKSGSKYGVDPDVEFLPRGVTTVLSQGDAGAAAWPKYRTETIDGSRTRVRLAINFSRSGEAMPGGCFEKVDDLDVEACVAAIQDGGDLIWGIAVNVSNIACGDTDPREVLRLSLDAAERTGRPLMYGMRASADWPIAEQMALLRPGDLVTYSFRSEPFGIVAGGHVLPEIVEARERGILFDAAHGMASLDYATAEAALADGFFPDTISTDQYAKHVGSVPQHDMPRMMSKLIAAGFPEADVLAAVTIRPARVLGLGHEVGTLAAGSCADLTVVRWKANATPLTDTSGAERPGACLEPVLTVRGGEVV